MKKLLSILLVITMMSGCQSTGGSMFGSNKSKKSGNFFSDQSVIMNVSKALSQEKELWRNSHISVLHHNKSLLLVGQTNSHEHRERSSRIASNTDGVDKIYNQIKIGKTISYAQRAKDSWITTQIKAKYFANKNIGFGEVKVLTENNRVYLMGTLAPKYQEIAVKIATEIDDVQEVLKIFDEPAAQ